MLLRTGSLYCVLLGAGTIAHAQPQPDLCAPPHKIEWPTGNPLWSLCWIAADSSSGLDGSGLELRDVFYKGKRVLRRAGIPLIDVDYDPGGCGSFRDWSHGLMTFEADNPVGLPGSHYAEPTHPPRTMCDHPGTDAGDFEGVAAEKTAAQLVLTTQLQAGPYRYVLTWTFRKDGSIDARIGFTSIYDPCQDKAHNHHAYWRFEFDLGGDGKDTADEARFPAAKGAPQWSRFRTETSRRNDPVNGGLWRVQSQLAHRGYEIVSSPSNGVADSWGVADLWVLAFHPDQIDDGGARQGPKGGIVHLDDYVNGESVDGAKLVLWTHAFDRHDNNRSCRFIGPTLRPIGNW
jgi:hypothetical protein